MEMTIRGSHGRFTTLGVRLETAEKVKLAAGNRPVYQFLDELIDKAVADGAQTGMIPAKRGRESVSVKVERGAVTTAAVLLSIAGYGFPRDMEVSEIEDDLETIMASIKTQLRSVLSQKTLPGMELTTK